MSTEPAMDHIQDEEHQEHQLLPLTNALTLSRRWIRLWRRTPERVRSINMRFLKHTTNTDITPDDIHLTALELLFGLGREHAQNWPGIIDMFRCLETKFGRLMDDEFDVIWNLIGREKPTHPRECWHWCFTVLRKFQMLRSNESVSISNIHQELLNDRLAESGVPMETYSALLAIFAVICWTSATTVPILHLEQNINAKLGKCPSFLVEGLESIEISQTSLDSTSRRPITKLFGILRDLIKDRDGAVNAELGMDTIYESTINFFSLHKIGGVRIRWVEDLVSHLAFDRQSRTLCVFCLPTFCVSSILRTQEIKVLQLVSAQLFPSIDADQYSQDVSSLHREILLTYRLLFGQSSRSRALALKLLEELKVSRKNIDPFLFIVCTTPMARSWFPGRSSNLKFPAYLFPATSLDLNQRLIEPDSYSSRDDFPYFGHRLLTLQQYNSRQQPSRVRDLWRDRRNPLQWYTFWAVLWVGGLTILLGVFQLVAAIMQTYYTVHHK